MRSYGPVTVHCNLDLEDMALGQSHDTRAPLCHGKQLCEILFGSNMAMRSYDPDTDFGHVCTVTLTLQIWPWVQVMTHPWVGDKNCVKYYPDPTWLWGVMAKTRILGMCALRPWPGRYNLGSKSWHTLGPWTTIVWNIIQIQQGSEELWPGQGFWVCVHCHLDLGDMTLGQGHDTPFCHGQQLCEILSRSDEKARSYTSSLDTLWTDRRRGWFLYTLPPPPPKKKTLFAGVLLDMCLWNTDAPDGNLLVLDFDPTPPQGHGTSVKCE